jgi:ubiquinone/menaquinone biosynthesis C-methylase UbiE
VDTRARKGRDTPERFDPATSSGRLVDAEHRARYWSAAALAEGRAVLDAGCGTGYGTLMLIEGGAASVTAIDIAEDAVGQTLERVDGRAEVVLGDVHQLPFDDASFDMVVCLEVIEHLDGQDAALAEFARVLRPEGFLVISSPNRDVYTPGNPHHVHEYTPPEFREALSRLFPSVTLLRQHAWVATGLLTDDAAEAGESFAPPVRLLDPLRPGKETYTVAVAAKGAHPDLPETVVLAEAFEVRWWHEQLEGARGELEGAREELEGAREELAHALRRIDALLADDRDHRSQIAELGGRLLELEQQGAQLAELRRRFDEVVLERERYGHEVQVVLAERDAEIDRTARLLRGIQSSRSWRLMKPIRALRGLGRQT